MPRVVLLCLIAIAGWSAAATDFSWTGATTGDWATNANWTPNNGSAGDPNGNDNIARFAGPGSNQPVLGNNREVNQLNFDAGGDVSLAGGSTLTLSGISPIIVVTSGTQSITCPISLGANTTIQVAAGCQLAISGVITGNFTLTKTGSGLLILSGANGYTGLTTVSAGTLRIEHATALGTGASGTTVAVGATLALANNITVSGEAITLNGTLRFDAVTGCTLSGAVSLTIGGTPSIEALQGTHTIAAATNLVVNADVSAFVASGASLSIGDTDVTGNGLLSKVGNGTLVLSDITAPMPPTITAPINGSTVISTTPTWTWTPTGGAYRYNLDSGALIQTTTASFVPGAALGNGSHTLTVAQRDAAGNWSTASSNTITIDGLPPTVVARRTLDLNTDGFIDAIEVTFSETMDSTAIKIGSWIVTGYTTGTPTWVAGKLRIPLTPKTVSDTGAMPLVRHVRPGTAADVLDAAGNALSTEVLGSVASDGAGPIILRVEATTGSNQLTVVFSEPVTDETGSTLAIGDFTYANNAVGGATNVASVVDGNGLDSIVSLATNVAVAGADLSADTLAPIPAKMIDAAGNAAVATPIVLATPTPAFLSTTTGGDWLAATTWVENRTPVSTDDVRIVGPVTLARNAFADCNTLTFSGAGSMSCSGGAPGINEYCLVRIFGSNNQVTALDDTVLTDINLWDRSNFGATYDIFFTVAGGATLTLNNTIQGQWARTVVKRGDGVLVWNAPAALYDPAWDNGPTRIEAGIFRLLIADGRPPAYELAVSGGATCDLRVNFNASPLTGQGTITRSAAGTTLLTMAGSTWSGTIQNGSGSLNVSASGVNFWTGINTNTGGVSLTAGSLTVSGTQAIADTCPVAVASGALLTIAAAETIGPLSSAGTITLNAGLTVNHAATTSAFSGSLNGTGGLTVVGNVVGSLTLGGVNNYSGGTTLGNGGTVVVSSNVALGATASALSFDAGRLRLGANLNLTSAAVATTAIGSGPSATLVVQGTPAVDRPISVTTNGGTIILGAFSLAVPGFSTAVGQNLTITGNGTTGVNTADPALFVVVPSGTATWAGEIATGSAFGFLCKRGAGSLAITNGANSWTKNVVRAEEGTLTFGASGSLGSVVNWVFVLPGATGRLDNVTYASAPTLFLSGTLGVNGTSSWQGPTDLWSSTPVVDVSTDGQLTLAGTVSATLATSLTKTGLGTLVMGAINTFGNPVTVSGGTLVASADDRLGNAANSITLSSGTLSAPTGFASSRSFVMGSGGGTFNVSSGQTLTLNGVVSGGSLVKTGTGVLSLTGTNSHGATTVQAGATAISSNASLGTNGAGVVLDGGTLRSGADIQLLTRNVTVNGGGGSFDVTAGTLEVTGVLGGIGTITKSSAGALALSGTNTCSGPIIAAAGTLSARSSAALGTTAGSTVVADGAVLDLAGSFSTAEPIQLAGTGIAGSGVLISSVGDQTLTGAITLVQTVAAAAVSVSGTLTVNGVISGSGGLSKLSAGELVLGVANTFTGQVTVAAGALALNANANLGATGNEVLLNGGTLRAQASFASATRAVRIGTAGGTIDTTASGWIVGLPGIDTGPAQNLTLGGSGTVVFGVGAGVNATLAGRISGTAGMVKAGNGDLVVTNAINDLTGTTTVTNGQLFIAGVLPNAVTIATGGTLTGTGTIGTLTVQAGGVVSPGGAGAGVLTVGSFAPAANSTLNMNIGGASDLISVTGSSAVVLAGSIALSGEDTAPNSTYTLISAPAAAVSGLMTFSPDPNDVNARYLLQTTATQLQVVRDSVTPSVIAITSPDPDGEYVSGDSVTVRVVFSEPVNLTGGLRLTLNTAPSVTVDIPASAVGVFTAAFDGTYVVVAPQVAADLNVTAIALLSSGAYADAVGNTVATVALPSSGQNLGGLKNIVIVNRAPVVQINGATVGDTTPPAYALASAGASVLLCDPAVSGKLDVVAVDPESASPLTWTLRLDPSVGVLERFNTGSSAWEQVQTTVSPTFTQDDVQNNRVRYRHTGSVGGNDAVLVDCQDPQGNVSPLFLIRFSIAGNGPPVVANFDGDTLSYLEPSIKPGPYLAIDGDLTVTSVRSALTGGTLNITVQNGSGDDQIDLIAPATVLAGTVSVSGIPVATATNLGSNAVSFTLLAGATPANTAALIKSVGYRSNDVSPSVPGNRSINLTITDGTPGGGITVVAKAIALDPWNEAPVVSGADVATVPGLTRTGSITATDPEGLAQNQMTLSVVQNPALGTLVFNAAAGTYSYIPNFLPALTSDNVVLDTFIIGATDQAFAATNPRVASPSAATVRTPARIGQHTVTVRITNSGATGLTFRNAPRMTVNTGGIFNYLPQVNALPGAVLSYELINDPGVTGFNPTTGLTNWNPVPAAGASGYYRFGLLVTDATSGISAYLPIMLRVGLGGTG